MGAAPLNDRPRPGRSCHPDTAHSLATLLRSTFRLGGFGNRLSKDLKWLFGLRTTAVHFKEQAQTPLLITFDPTAEFGAVNAALARNLRAMAVRGRHATYCVQLAEQAASPRLDGASGPDLLERLELEHDNMRAALTWLLDHDGESAVRLAGALWSFWEMRAHLSEGLDWLAQALDRTPAVAPAVRARALIGAAALRRARGETSAAASLARQSTMIRRKLGDSAALAESLIILATIVAQSGQAGEAIALVREGVAIRRERADTVGTAWALLELATIMSFEADFLAARAHAEEAVGLRRGQSDNVLDAWLGRCLGSIRSGEGDTARARPLLEQACELFSARRDATGLAWSLLGLGDLLFHEGDIRGGQAVIDQAKGHFDQLGERRGTAIASRLLGRQQAQHVLAELEASTLAAAWRFALGRDLAAPADCDTNTGGGGGTGAVRSAPTASSQRLTVREHEVLTLLSRHYTNRDIAEELVLSTRTVERHVANIYGKIGVSSRRLAATYARGHGLLAHE